MANQESCYSGKYVALLTQNGKERQIAPELESALGCRVNRVMDFDTDLLGALTREIPRAGTQTEAARKKARIGMQLSGLPFGLGSEGSFEADPYAWLFPLNVEMLVFIDDERELEIIGTARGKANISHLLTSDWDAAKYFARESLFPEHHLVVRPEGETDRRIRKGIAAWDELETAFAEARQKAANGQVFLETDIRAHANPTRQENIRLAAADLANKLCSCCPACGLPGFWMVERLTGLPCEDCGAPTYETRAEIHGCLKCGHRITVECPKQQFADPRHCNYCNP